MGGRCINTNETSPTIHISIEMFQIILTRNRNIYPRGFKAGIDGTIQIPDRGKSNTLVSLEALEWVPLTFEDSK
jgi:hypothetical protein